MNSEPKLTLDEGAVRLLAAIQSLDSDEQPLN